MAALFFIVGLFSGEPGYQALLTFLNIGANEKVSLADALNLISLKIHKEYIKLSKKLDYANKIISLYDIFATSKASSIKIGDWYVDIMLDHSYGQRPMVKGHVEQKEFETYFNKKYKMTGSKLTHFL